MSFIEEVSRMSKSGYSDIELLEYIDEQFNEIECELNGEEYKEPKHNRNLCIDCNAVKTIDYERSTLVCTNVVYVSTIPFMQCHIIIRCNLREGNAYTRDLIILKSY